MPVERATVLSPRQKPAHLVTNQTKASLAEALEAATARIEQLEAQLAEQPQAPIPAHLDQILWLQRKALTQIGPDGKGNIGYTDGGTLLVRFGAQYASLDRQSGQRIFGAWKFFTAYGDVAQAVINFMAGTDRLCRIQAYEQPYASNNDPNARQSEWVVRGLTPIGRGAGNPPEAPATAPAPARAAATPATVQPTLTQVGF